MASIKNPFLIYGYVSPDYFCDREEETKQLISALRNGRNVTFMSPRRMGKTGLIMNAFHHIQKDDPAAVCIYLDIFPTKNLHGFVSLFAKTVLGKADGITQNVKQGISSFFQSIRPVLSADPLTGALTASVDFKPQESGKTLSELFSYLKDSGKECYIAIDEFQQISEYAEDEGIEALLRSYIQFCPNVHFVFSGSKQHLMSAIFDSPQRPFFRSTQKITLPCIAEKPYYLFAATNMAKAGIEFPQEIFHLLYEMFEGHTWYMQNILNHLYEKASPAISKNVIYDCIKEILAAEKEDYSRMLHMLTLNQSQLLIAIAKEGVVPAINAAGFISKYNLKGTSSVNKALAYLVDNEYVYRSENGYMIYDRFLGIWLKQM